MTLKAKVKNIFTKPPCSFVFRADDTQAIGQAGAVLQCKTDDQASLVVMMPRRYPDVVTRSTNLLIALLLVAGWRDGDAWLAQCFRAAAPLPEGKIFEADHGGKHYTLIVNRTHELTTLTVQDTHDQAEADRAETPAV